MKIKHLNFQLGRIRLKELSGAKANQPNHYIIPTLEESDYDCALVSTTFFEAKICQNWKTL